MSQLSGYFNSIEGDDRYYDAEGMNMVFEYLVSNGVFHGGSELEVIPGEDVLSVEVTPGKAMVNAHWYKLTPNTTTGETNLKLHVPPAISQPYIGRVVLRMNNVQDETGRHVTLAFKAGVESSSPVAPALQREDDDSIWEICLAEVTVYPTTMIIETSQIKDTRFDYALCGIADFGPNPKIEGVVAQGFTQSVFWERATFPPEGWELVDPEQYPDYEGEYMRVFVPERSDLVYSDMDGIARLIHADERLDKPAPSDMLVESGRIIIFYEYPPWTEVTLTLLAFRSGVNLYG